MRTKPRGLGLAVVLAAMAMGTGVRPAGAQQRGMKTVYLVLLEKGPAWTAQETPAIEKLQTEHMANIRALFRARKLVIAGPIDNQAGDLRGVFILEAASLDEAKALVATDPGVKAGRITPVIYPWWVEKGALPEAGTYCSPPSGR